RQRARERAAATRRPPSPFSLLSAFSGPRRLRRRALVPCTIPSNPVPVRHGTAKRSPSWPLRTHAARSSGTPLPPPRQIEPSCWPGSTTTWDSTGEHPTTHGAARSPPPRRAVPGGVAPPRGAPPTRTTAPPRAQRRSEEHTSELH